MASSSFFLDDDPAEDRLYQALSAMDAGDAPALRACAQLHEKAGAMPEHHRRMLGERLLSRIYNRTWPWPDMLAALKVACPGFDPFTHGVSPQTTLAHQLWRYGSADSLHQALAEGALERNPPYGWPMLLWVFQQGHSTTDRITDATAKMQVLLDHAEPEVVRSEVRQVLNHHLSTTSWTPLPASLAQQINACCGLLLPEDLPVSLAPWLAHATESLARTLVTLPAVTEQVLVQTLDDMGEHRFRHLVEAALLQRDLTPGVAVRRGRRL